MCSRPTALSLPLSFFRGFSASDQSEADAVRLLDKMSASEAGSPDLGRRQQEPPLRSTSGDVNGTAVRIKKEPEEDIKDFAETTMNELLGWYGYDKVNTGETKGINLSLSRFSSSSSPPQEGSESEDGSRDTTESRVLAPDSTGDSAAGQLNSGAGSVIIECSWCSKTGLKLFTLKTSGREPKAFCSELCFNQCRRATFKKSRICDWCKHVRHTVNYVDFQDGAHQLQFCGDKCLNQYKMHIFCKETQAYLQMHPHLQEVARSGSDVTGAGSKLITPDLWLRDCKDAANGAGGYNVSVHSDDETEPDGTAGSGSAAEQEEPPSFATHRTSNIPDPQPSSKPCDTTHTPSFNVWEKIENTRKEFSKSLKSKDASRRNGRQSSRNESLLPRRPVISSISPKPSPLPQARERSSLSPVHINHSAQMNGSPHHTLSTRTSPNLPQPPRIVPSSSPSLPTQPHSHTSSTSSGSSIPPGIPPPPPLINSELFRPPFPPHFYHPSFNYLSQQQQLEYFLRSQGSGLGMRLGMTPPPPPPAHFPHASFSNPFLQPPNPMPLTSHSFGSNSLIPPPTIMIPYPLIIPLPLPIPIPIPIPLLGTAKKAATKDTTDHPEGNSTDNLDLSVSESQDVSVTETNDSPRWSNSSSRSKTEENILIDVEDVKDTQTTDSVVHSPPAPVEEQTSTQLHVRTDEGHLTEQPMALTRSKSRNSRGFASPRESKRPRLTERDGL